MNLSELAYQEKRKMEMLQAKMRGLRIGDDGNMLIGKRRSNGGMEFYIKRKGSGQRKYIDRESQEMIPMLLRDRFAAESLKVLEKNDKALAAFLADYQEFDPETVMSGLPKTYQYAREFCEKNGLKRINIHSLRHLNATLLINSGADIRTTSAALGHSNTTTTLNIYAHTFEEAQAKASEAVADILKFGGKEKK